jgi:SAM-dependent methyltransferase
MAKEKIGKNNNTKLIHGDFLTYQFENKFDKIFFLFTGFGYFDDKTNEKIIEKVSNLLVSGGLFLLDLASLYAVHFQAEHHTKKEFDGVIRDAKSSLDEKNSRIKTTCKITDKKNNKEKEYSFSYRYYTQKEINSMFKKYDLEIINEFGDYKGLSVNKNSKRNIYIAKKTLNMIFF